MSVNPALWIERNQQSAKLYALEEAATSRIIEAAEELGKLMGFQITRKFYDKNYWETALPQELYTVLDSFSATASVEAAKTYLEQRGWKVSES